jgi:predicted enzyme related to lactoylglutathione lyase
MNFYSKYFPVVASAYSAAMFVYFTFISKENISGFMSANIALMSFWAAYCWIVIYNQDNLIMHLTSVIESVLEKLKLLIEEEEEEEEEA